MSYKRIHGYPDQDFDESEHFAKKPRIENAQFLNFNDPPSSIFHKLKIPRRVGNRTSANNPLVDNTVSPILPPFSGFEENFKNVDDPVTKALIDNITGKLDGKTSKLKYYRCEECNLSLSGEAPLTAHYAGARHAKKIKEIELCNGGTIDDLKENKVKKLSENEFKCKLCDVKAESLVQIKTHIDGIKHKKKLQAYRDQKSKKHQTSAESRIPNDESSIIISQGKKSVSSAVKSSSNLSSNKPTASKADPSHPFHCHICGLSMNSQQQYDQHINSKKHAAKLTKLAAAKNEEVLENVQVGSANENS